MPAIAILGSTGTIGVNTLDVIRRYPERFRVAAVTANRNHERLLAQCREFQPDHAVILDPAAAAALEAGLRAEGLQTRVSQGVEGLKAVAADPDVDIVMAAIVGAAGLVPTLAAARAGKRLLLANKEALVMGGHLFMDAVREGGAQLLPVDSEHNAIFQCMPAGYHCGETPTGIRSVVLTASGGPFRGWDPARLATVSPEQACAHPNWRMGRKISVDSATMMNKGLELIEAAWLFALEPEQIRVVLHPESVVHSMVEYEDGSVIAQLGQPDMRTPIACGLSWPDRLDAGVESLDLIAAGRLSFEPPDRDTFPCLALAEEALRAGGAMPLVLNAANEVAVASFLGGDCRFVDIPEKVQLALRRFDGAQAGSLDELLALDGEVRASLSASDRRQGSA
jgi:1-deoxy-D-xylulose-5-phosphate reductoisomerase